MLGRVTATIIRRTTTTDRYNDATPAADPERIPVRGCQFAPRSSNDINGPGRQGVLVGYTLYLPARTDIRIGDQVEVADVVYEIEGEPGDWTRSSSQLSAGIEVALRQAKG